MRLILGIILLLVGVGLWSLQLDGRAEESAPVRQAEPPWVRTAQGWERATWLTANTRSRGQDSSRSAVQLHPLVLAAGEALFSLLALAAFCPTSRGKQEPRK